MRYLLILLLAGCCAPPPRKPVYHIYLINGYYYVFDEHWEWVDPVLYKNSAEQ